jgi:hypothetical protein
LSSRRPTCGRFYREAAARAWEVLDYVGDLLTELAYTMHHRAPFRFALTLLVIAVLLLSLAHGLSAPAIPAIALLVVAIVVAAEPRIAFQQPTLRSVTISDRLLDRAPPA